MSLHNKHLRRLEFELLETRAVPATVFQSPIAAETQGVTAEVQTPGQIYVSNQATGTGIATNSNGNAPGIGMGITAVGARSTGLGLGTSNLGLGTNLSQFGGTTITNFVTGTGLDLIGRSVDNVGFSPGVYNNATLGGSSGFNFRTNVLGLSSLGASTPSTYLTGTGLDPSGIGLDNIGFSSGIANLGTLGGRSGVGLGMATLAGMGSSLMGTSDTNNTGTSGQGGLGPISELPLPGTGLVPGSMIISGSFFR
jgi:hypothetical protein